MQRKMKLYVFFDASGDDEGELAIVPAHSKKEAIKMIKDDYDFYHPKQCEIYSLDGGPIYWRPYEE